MVLLDLLGRRMTLRILWELFQARQPLTFRALQSAAETNPSVLNSRLRELRAARIVEYGAGGYQLSATGDTLMGVILPLHAWAERWAARAKSASDAAGRAPRKT